MNTLPIEGFCWLNDFKARVALESAIVRSLIRWGLTEHAFDIHRQVEKRFNEALESFAWKRDSRFRLPKADRLQIQEILREHYLRTRDLPCRRAFREKLHNGFLTGFEELSDLVVGFYEEYVHQFHPVPSREEAA